MTTDSETPLASEQAAVPGFIFGVPQIEAEAELVLLPVPFDATTSYRPGTSEGPQNILEASLQVDLFHELLDDPTARGIFFLPIHSQVQEWNRQARQLVEQLRDSESLSTRSAQRKEVNAISSQLNEWVYQHSKRVLSAGKILGIVGGDHACPFGAIKAQLEKFPNAGILHFDAHHDLRNAYEGFEDSHASIFYNVLQKLPVKKLVQVGIRDYSLEEKKVAQNDERVKVFYDHQLFEWKSMGKTWKEICSSILDALPQEVYISLDIDGLDPLYCPNTGTPVPGGLSYQELIYLLRQVVKSGRKIVGFDLMEVGPGEYDGVVGARVLYELCTLSLLSRSPTPESSRY